MTTSGIASREARAAARERLTALGDVTSVDLTALAGDLAAVTELLDREVGLRRVLTDPSRPGGDKAELAGRLLGGRVGGETVDLVSGMVRTRWSASRDLVDAVEELADTADLLGAERVGALDTVEDELFRISRIVASSPELRAALGVRDTGEAARAAKSALVHRLLGERTHPVTERLVTRLTERPRGRSLDAGLEGLSSLAAELRHRSVAVVTTAVPLSDRQQRRLGDALARLYGRQIRLNLDVDPRVLGGILVRIGDEVIQGTVAGRLDEVDRRLD